MHPIPKRLLIHKVTAEAAISKDRWGKETSEQAHDLEHVRIEPSKKVVRGKDNVEIQLAAILFFDCHYSRPRDQKFADGMIFEFNGEKLRVATVEPLYDEGRLHHYEIGLVAHGG